MADSVKSPLVQAMLGTGSGTLYRIARLVRHVAGVPVAAISVGPSLAHAADDTATISAEGIYTLNKALDAIDAPRVIDDLATTHPAVAKDTGLRAVAAAPVRDTLGRQIGLLWGATSCSSTLSEDVVEQLDTLAWLAGAWLSAARLAGLNPSTARPVEPRHYGLVLTNPDGRILWVNESFVDLCGYSLDEVVGRRPRTFLQGPATDAATVDAVRGHVQAGSGFKAELVNYRKSGEPYWVQIQAEPIHNRNGELAGFIALETEVEGPLMTAEASPSEHAATPRSRQQVLDVASNTVEALIVITDADGRIMRCNEACHQLTGYALDEFIGTLITDQWVPDEDIAMVEAALEAYRAGRMQSTFECPLITRDGEQRLIDWSNTVVPDAEGHVQYLVWTGIDITEQRELEEELMEVSSEERRRIGQDLHDILASHLAGTAMVAQSLSRKRSRGEPVSVDDLDLIVKYINEAAHQTRALSHLLMPEHVKSAQLAEALRKLAQNKEELTGVQHRVDAQADLSGIDDATATHLYRIAYEAINNAIKHAEPNQVRMQLRTEGDRLHLIVQDDGTGIERPDHVSTGLGLRMMKHRANIIHARLDVRPTEAGGTQVRCIVPLGETG